MPVEAITLRRSSPGDGSAIAAIQRASPAASQWDPAGYDVVVAEIASRVAGFLVTRTVAPDEVEILNLAVAPEFRRAGVARALVTPLLTSVKGSVYLEVRESNSPARMFYQSLGFQEVSCRPQYYPDPLESAVVMKFHSC